jgi:hypothetical protein
MLKDNIYNINREFDYGTIKAFLVESLENIVREEGALENIHNDVIFDSKDSGNSDSVSQAAPPTPLLKLKIRNTTKYLSWRLSILKRDSFTRRICHASVKENKSLRLEVHHSKSFVVLMLFIYHFF